MTTPGSQLAASDRGAPPGPDPVVVPARERERPIGVTLVAAVQGLNAVATGLEVIAGRRAVPSENTLVLAPIGVAIALGGLVVAVGLWRLQSWAWTATMIWVGVVMALALLAYFEGSPSYVVMALSVMQVFYLNQSDVQRVFGRAPGERP